MKDTELQDKNPISYSLILRVHLVPLNLSVFFKIRALSERKHEKSNDE